MRGMVALISWQYVNVASTKNNMFFFVFNFRLEVEAKQVADRAAALESQRALLLSDRSQQDVALDEERRYVP